MQETQHTQRTTPTNARSRQRREKKSTWSYYKLKCKTLNTHTITIQQKARVKMGLPPWNGQ